MSIIVDGSPIQQIILGGESYISKVYYGNTLVWEAVPLADNNTPTTKTVYLTPGLYEVIVVGGGGGSAATGGGGSGDSGSNTANPIGGE